MSKTKINVKFWVVFFGLVMLAGLIPFGIQAIAADEPQQAPAVEATEALPTEEAVVAAPQNATCEMTFEYSDSGFIYYDGEMNPTNPFYVESGTKLISRVLNEVGYLYKDEATEANLIAKAYPQDWCICNGWSINPVTPGNGPQDEWVITSDSVISATYEDVVTPMSGTLTGWVKTYDTALGKEVPLEGVEAYYAEPGTEVYYYAYTDLNGYFRITGIPFNLNGCLNGYKEGYVAEYSDVIVLTQDNFCMSYKVTMMPGIRGDFVSKADDCQFHVQKFYRTAGVFWAQPTLVEDVIVPSIENRMFPETATVQMLDEQSCKDEGYRFGTLYYFYYYNPSGITGGTIYEIYVEPTVDVSPAYWYYSNDVEKNRIVPTDWNNPVEFKQNVGDYKFTFTDKEMYNCHVDPNVEGHEKFILSYYQDGEVTFAPEEVYDAVALYEDGTTWVDLFGRLHCTLTQDMPSANGQTTYEMILEAVGDSGHSIYNFYGKIEDEPDWKELTTDPIVGKHIVELIPTYEASGNVALAMAEGVDHYTYSLDINGLPALEDQLVNQDYAVKLFAGTQFDVLDDGSLQFEFENPDDNYTQEGNVEYTAVSGYKINGWTINDMPVETGMTIEQGGTYIIKANVENPNVPQTSDSTILIFAALAGLAVACFFSTRYQAIRNARS